MTALRTVAGLLRTQSLLAFMLIGTTCYLAYTGAIDGPSFIALAFLAVAFYFKAPPGKPE